MKFEIATESNIEEIMTIYDNARNYMRENGNHIQWRNGYPSKEIVLSDIKKRQCLIYIRDGKIAAVFSLDYNVEPKFVKLSEGSWLNDEPYVVIKRIAVAHDMHKKGIGNSCFIHAIKHAAKRNVRNIRIMTHKDNIAMLKAMEKFGFKYCGVVDLNDGHPRIVYQYCEPLVCCF